MLKDIPSFGELISKSVSKLSSAGHELGWDLKEKVLTPRLPDQEWLSKEVAFPPHTPDFWKLEQQDFTLIFEYGDLQDRMPKHQMVNPYYSTSAFTVNKFPVLKQYAVEEPFPLAFRHNIPGRKIQHSKIRGELYAVPPVNHVLIDSYRRNGLLFERERVKVLTPSVNEAGKHLSFVAWMYFAREEHWSDMLVWDSNFYKRGNGLFTPLNQHKHNETDFNNHVRFSPKDLNVPKKQKCFISLRDGEITDMIQHTDTELEFIDNKIAASKPKVEPRPYFVFNSKEETVTNDKQVDKEGTVS